MGRRQRALLLGTASYLAVGVLAPRLAVAEVATDGTMGRRVSLRGGNIEIGADLGQQRGGNLFHSFRKFDVETRGRVAFTGPDSVKNVIGRVTGGEVSSIDGTLANTIPDADLYLINPAGIMFGPNARLDVKGSFHASTADELWLTDGAVFSALDLGGSTLTVAPPQAFGFLGSAPGQIRVNESILTVPNHEALSLVGGEIDIVGGPEGILEAPAGAITLAALGGSGSADIQQATAVAEKFANINLRDLAAVYSSGEGGGRIRILGDTISLTDQSRIFNDNEGTLNASDGITIVAGALELTQASRITTDSFSTGNAGPIVIQTTDLSLDGSSYISSRAFDIGNAGNIEILVDTLWIANYSTIASNSENLGNAGRIDISARGITLMDSSITSQALSDGYGGDIRIRSDELSLLSVNNGDYSGSEISSTTYGGGDGGNIIVESRSIALVGSGIINNVLSTGNGGSIDITSEYLNMQEGAISTLAGGGSSGKVGRIDINAKEINMFGFLSFIQSDVIRLPDPYRSIVGREGSITINAEKISMFDSLGIKASTGTYSDGGTVTINVGELFLSQTAIFTSTGDVGNGGSIAIRADTISLFGSYIQSDSSGSSLNQVSGDAGSISITATNLLLAGAYNSYFGVNVPSVIDTSAGKYSEGNAGAINIASENIVVRDRGTISSTTLYSGVAGSIAVSSVNLSLQGGGAILASTFGDGDGGTVTVRAGNMAIQGVGSQISSATSGVGRAGSVQVDALSIALTDFGRISSSAEFGATGTAGSVRVSAPDVQVASSGAISASTAGPGVGGQVRVDGARLVLTDGGTISSGTLGSGDAGDVNVALTESLCVGGGSINTSGNSGSGRAGSVSVVAPSISLAGAAVTGPAIGSQALGSGAAGSVHIATASDGSRAGMLALSDGASINTSTNGAGVGGSIAVTTGALSASGASEIASDTLGGGDAGSVGVDALVVRLEGSSRIASDAVSGSGGAGSVSVSAPAISVADSAEISAGTATSGNAGDVGVSGERLTLAGRGSVTSGSTAAGGRQRDSSDTRRGEANRRQHCNQQLRRRYGRQCRGDGPDGGTRGRLYQ